MAETPVCWQKNLVWGQGHGHFQKWGYEKTLGCCLQNLEFHVSYFEVTSPLGITVLQKNVATCYWLDVALLLILLVTKKIISATDT